MTLRGEIFHAAGPVQAGQAGKSTPLARPRQRRELGQAVEAAQAALAAAETKLARAGEAIGRLRQEADAAAAALRQARGDEEKANSAYSRERAAAEQAARQSRWQGEQETRLKADLGRVKEETAGKAALRAGEARWRAARRTGAPGERGAGSAGSAGAASAGPTTGTPWRRWRPRRRRARTRLAERRLAWAAPKTR